jgi:Protein of unknown function (DUF3667)
MICKNCGIDGTGKFCADCGQKLSIGRIKFKDLLHELIHTFTHFEKGYLYTLKQLALHPGTMQKEYVSGARAKYQKPFPMFVISGTICALALYTMHRSAPDNSIQYFYRNYYVFVHIALLPVQKLQSILRGNICVNDLHDRFYVPAGNTDQPARLLFKQGYCYTY